MAWPCAGAPADHPRLVAARPGRSVHVRALPVLPACLRSRCRAACERISDPDRLLIVSAGAGPRATSPPPWSRPMPGCKHASAVPAGRSTSASAPTSVGGHPRQGRGSRVPARLLARAATDHALRAQAAVRPRDPRSHRRGAWPRCRHRQPHRLLRELRDAGMACEQRRFADLLYRKVEERLVTARAAGPCWPDARCVDTSQRLAAVPLQPDRPGDRAARRHLAGQPRRRWRPDRLPASRGPQARPGDRRLPRRRRGHLPQPDHHRAALHGAVRLQSRARQRSTTASPCRAP